MNGEIALVMLALTVGLVGFEIRDIPGGLALWYRFDDVAVVVVWACIPRTSHRRVRRDQRSHRPQAASF